MDFSGFIGRTISIINYELCQYHYEPVIHNDAGTKTFKIWLLSKNVNNPKNNYYYLLVDTNSDNEIMDIKAYVGNEDNESLTENLNFCEEYIANSRLHEITDVDQLEKEFLIPLYGKQIDEKRLATLGKYNNPNDKSGVCKEYYYCNADFWDDNNKLQELSIPGKLLNTWKEKNIDFSVYFYLRDQILQGVKLYKARVKYGSFRGPETEELNITKQDYKVARNIVNMFVL